MQKSANKATSQCGKASRYGLPLLTGYSLDILWLTNSLIRQSNSREIVLIKLPCDAVQQELEYFVSLSARCEVRLYAENETVNKFQASSESKRWYLYSTVYPASISWCQDELGSSYHCGMWISCWHFVQQVSFFQISWVGNICYHLID